MYLEAEVEVSMMASCNTLHSVFTNSVNPGICSVWDERRIISTANWNTGNLRHMYLFWDICSKWKDRIRHGQVERRTAAI